MTDPNDQKFSVAFLKLFVGSLDLTTAGDELRSDDGACSIADGVVEFLRCPESPGHDLVEWDDAKAAHLWRRAHVILAARRLKASLAAHTATQGTDDANR